MRLLMSAAFICVMGTAGYMLGMSWGEGGIIAWAQLFCVAGVFFGANGLDGGAHQTDLSAAGGVRRAG